jgi:hypothetical protein
VAASLVSPAAKAGLLADDLLIATLPRRRWDWTIERLALARINTDRPAALRLLQAAFAIDLDPQSTWRRKRALRLYDLYAAAARPAERSELAALVLASPRSGPALHARARLWADPERPSRARSWRTTGANGAPIGFVIDPV